MHRVGMISIWFFIGVPLLLYGVLILGAGIYDLSNPAAYPVVRSGLCAGVWWGALLIALGAVYWLRIMPRRRK